MRAQWLGGPKDGEWLQLRTDNPVTVLVGSHDHPTKLQIKPERRNGIWVLDFYNATIVEEDHG
jgi:hypothetical protein